MELPGMSSSTEISILLIKVQAFKAHEVIKSGKYVGLGLGLANIFGELSGESGVIQPYSFR